MSQLPKNWIRVPLGTFIIECNQRVPEQNEEFKYIDISSVNRDTKRVENPQILIGKDAPSRARKHVKSGDVLVSMTRPNLNAVALVPDELNGQIASTGFDILRTSEVDPRWIFNLVRATNFVKAMSDLVQGALYPAVRSKDIRGFEAPFAPLNEQKRIADKLDSIFARVDACRERLDRIPVILKHFRQAVLAAATSGKLTEEWRENCSLSFNWPQVKLADVASSRLGKMLDKNKNQGELIPYLRNINVRWFDFNLNDIQKIQVSLKEKNELNLRSGDVMICEGGEPGRCAVWRETASNFVYQKALHRVRVSDQLLPKYLCYVIKAAADDHSLAKLFTGTTIKHLTGISLNRFAFLLPPLQEQTEIVRRVEELFAYADRIEARYHAARAQVDKLTPAILAKAFRGELVPQDPNDEPASVLLDRIRASRAENALTPKPKRSRKLAAK